jgi:hypothetical protein
MTKHVSTLLQKEVSRKEFLGMSGLAVASIFGFGAVIKLVTGKSLTSSLHGHQAVMSGYGSSAYGGFKESH